MPLARTKNAPIFAADASGFDDFFDNVDELGRRTGEPDSEKKKWACRYAGSESDSWKHASSFGDDTKSFIDFKADVLLRYPHLCYDRRYTINDLEKLVERTQDYREMSRTDLGTYYRKFISISQYLIDKGRLSTRERSSLYLKGFPQPTRVRILHRLSIKQPDILPDEGYEFTDIHDAATFVLSASLPSIDAKPEPKTEPANGDYATLVRMMTNLTSAVNNQPRVVQPHVVQPRVVQPTPGGVVAQPPPGGRPQQPANGCMFCGHTGHYVKECQVVAEYMRLNKVTRNEANRLVLPDGRYPPKGTPGRNYKEKIDHCLATREAHMVEIASTNFLETAEDQIFEIEVSPVEGEPSGSPLVDEDLDLRLRNLMEDVEMVLALRKSKEQFDGVEVPPLRIGPPRRPQQPPPLPPKPTIHAQRPSSPPQKRVELPQGPIKPVANVPKTEEPKHRYRAPIEHGASATKVVSRILRTFRKNYERSLRGNGSWPTTPSISS